MMKNPTTIPFNSALYKTALLQLESNLRKKSWLWIGFVVAFAIIFMAIGFHLTLVKFILSVLLSFSLSYSLFSTKRLVLCTRFLKSQIKNKPKSSLKQTAIFSALKITRRCLHQFCLSHGFIFFAAIVFLANPNDLSHSFFYNLLLLLTLSGLIYGISLVISHLQLTAVLGHPILSFLSTLKSIHPDKVNPDDFSVHDFPVFVNEADPSETVRENIDEAKKRLESCMYVPGNPASPIYQIMAFHKQLADEEDQRILSSEDAYKSMYEKF